MFHLGYSYTTEFCEMLYNSAQEINMNSDQSSTIFFCVLILAFCVLGMVYAVRWWQQGQKLRQQEADFKKYFNYVMANGTPEEKQLALMYYQTKQLDQLRGLIGLDILLHM